MSVLLQNALGTTRTVYVRGCTTDGQACSHAERAARREEPAQGWRAIRAY